jgi:hypothetical protein
VHVARKLSHRGVEAPQELIGRNRVCQGKPDQLIENVIPPLGTGVLKDHPARDHLVGNPTEPASGLNAKIARIFPLEPPSGRQDPEVIITFNQVISNH